MSGNLRRRQLLLSTAAFMGTLIGYGRGAYAQCALVPPTTNTYKCENAVGVTQSITGVDNAYAYTVSGFSAGTSGTPITGSSIEISGDGAIRFVDTVAGTTLVATVYGIDITSTGNDVGGGIDGSVYVSTNATIFGYDAGIFASNNGSGSLEIIANGDVERADIAAIDARNAGADLRVTTGADADIVGSIYGIYASNTGVGDTDITVGKRVRAVDYAIYAKTSATTGALTIGAARVESFGYGIYAKHAGTGDLTITTTGEVTTDLQNNFGRDAIRASNTGSGAIDIKTYGDVTTGNRAGYDPVGIYARNGTMGTPAGTNLSVTTAAGTTVTGEAAGILTHNHGSGFTDITANGNVTGTNSAGIEAYNNTGATDLTVTAEATVSGGTFGIYAFNNGGGFVEITANGGVAATVEDGIRAEGGGTDLTVTAGAMVTGGNSGVAVNNFGNGATKVVTNGGVTGTAAYGIHAENAGTASSLTVTTRAAVMGGQRGILTSNKGTGATKITANGAVTGTARAGIEAYNSATATDLAVSAGAKVEGGTFGIYAFNGGGGATKITANGAATATVQDAIRVEHGGTNLAVTARRLVTGGNSGVAVNNFGTGATKITANGAVTGTTAFGIHAENAGTATDLTVTAGARVMGGQRGIFAVNHGTGATKIMATGNVTGTGRAGIEVYNNTSATNLTVTAGAGVAGGAFGIYAFNNGSGFVEITANGNVAGTIDDGIRAVSNGTPISVIVGPDSTVKSTGPDTDDFAVETAGGPTAMRLSGTLDGGAGGAIQFDQSTAFADVLQLRPGFEINGRVLAGPGADTLAFGGSGAGAFNLDRIDTGSNTRQFRSFESFKVESGVWSFSGATTAAFTQTGGTLGGNPTFGGLTVTGGTLAPGNSVGTVTVNGAFTLGAGAIYEVEANAAGNADKVVVHGTVNLTGATLKVLAASGNYKDSTNYTIIANDGTDPVKGKFGSVFTNLAFLIPTVDYAGGTGNDVVLTLERNTTLFQGVAKTKNEKAVAGALDEFPTNNQLFLAVLNQTESGARQAFNALSGEIHATVAGTLVDDSRYAREAVLGRMMQAGHQGEALGNGGPQVASYDSQAMMLGGAGLYDGKSLVDAPATAPLAFWTQGYGAWGTFDGDGNAATADRDLGGFISGMDASVGGSWRVGVATGASFSDVSVDQRYSGANTKTYHLGGYVNGGVSGFALRGGGLWAWSEIETSRAVVFPNFYERQTADYSADTGQLFGEIAYPTQMGGVELEPFGGFAYVSVDTGGFREKGGAQASLRTTGIEQDVGYTTVGLRAARTMLWGNTQITPHVEAAWLHAFDDVTPGASLIFATTGIGFAVDGVPLAEDSALLDAGLDFTLSDRLSAGVSYSGQYADDVSDNAVKGRLTWLFN